VKRLTIKRSITICLLVIVFTMVLVQPVLADWRLGNRYPDVYGVKAQISTPGSAPSPSVGGGTSSWVGTAPPDYDSGWVQTGWAYAYNNPLYNPATPYTEYRDDYGNYDQDQYSSQSWGTSKNYKLNFTPYGWAYYIDDDLKWIVGGFAYPPITVQAWSEVHDSSTNQLNTWFSSVQYRNSGGTWANFDQSNFTPASPYANYVVSNSMYCTYGP
jgi:hypothetical protein